MAFDLMKIDKAIMKTYALGDILACNERSEAYGLVLTPNEALELVETRQEALQSTGRLEFGGGIIEKIIDTFCTSPYLQTNNYPQMINELVAIFYAYKNETLDLISDDDLIALMNRLFNGVCQGSISQLAEGELEAIGRQVRRGQDYQYAIEKEDEDDE